MVNYKLYRCIIVDETKNYMVGRDIFNNCKYYIQKNRETAKFRLGNDSQFYAKTTDKGLLLKKIILEPIEYEKVINQ